MNSVDDAAKAGEEVVQTLVPENMSLWCSVMSRSRLSEGLGRCRAKEGGPRVNKLRGKVGRVNETSGLSRPRPKRSMSRFRPNCDNLSRLRLNGIKDNGLQEQEPILGRPRPKEEKLRLKSLSWLRLNKRGSSHDLTDSLRSAGGLGLSRHALKSAI